MIYRSIHNFIDGMKQACNILEGEQNTCVNTSNDSVYSASSHIFLFPLQEE